MPGTALKWPLIRVADDAVGVIETHGRRASSKSREPLCFSLSPPRRVAKTTAMTPILVNTKGESGLRNKPNVWKSPSTSRYAFAPYSHETHTILFVIVAPFFWLAAD
jgi:hypothetical protein